jgi:hypothetical protein
METSFSSVLKMIQIKWILKISAFPAEGYMEMLKNHGSFSGLKIEIFIKVPSIYTHKSCTGITPLFEV